MFQIGNYYTKKDIYQILKVPVELQRGSWDTGYRSYKNDVFIFANIGIAGRTGHDYDNHWEDGELVWYGKTGSHIGQKSIRNLLNPVGKIHIFTRNNSITPFTYSGEGTSIRYIETRPICIVWGFLLENNYFPDEVESTHEIKEGTLKTISVNQYERNSVARQICINHYGAQCQVCGFDFEKTYGLIGKEFIHVHHLVQLSSNKGEHSVNPLKDLIPVCPNCHAMLHRRSPPYSILELKSMINLSSK